MIQRKNAFRHKGFSLVELIIVIAILAVLVAITVPSYIGYVAKAKKSVLENNADGLADMIQIYAIDFSKDEWYGDWEDYYDDDGVVHGDPSLSLSMNNYIEYELETINDGTYENEVSLKNPYSGKMSILDKYTPDVPGDGYRPAVYLTNNTSYAYDGSGDTERLIGSIIVYFKTEYDNDESPGDTEHIEVFYINKDGSKSEYLQIIE